MAQQLASGRHGLSRDEVATNQKQRLFKALGEVMGTKGYSNTTVDDLIKHAGVSRATFYQHFDSKLDCFMAGYAGMQGYVIAPRTLVQHLLIFLDLFVEFYLRIGIQIPCVLETMGFNESDILPSCTFQPQDKVWEVSLTVYQETDTAPPGLVAQEEQLKIVIVQQGLAFR